MLSLRAHVRFCSSSMRHPDTDQDHLRNRRRRSQALEHATYELMLEALRARGEVRWVAHGHSMSSSIPSGSLVTIKRCDPYKLKCGEVILCTLGLAHEPQLAGSIDQLVREKAWILHRIIHHDREQEVITTCGDLTPRADDPWSYAQVLGVLSAVTAVEFKDAERRNTEDLSRRGASDSFRGLFKRALIKLVRWSHRRDPRSMLSRSLGLCIVRLYPCYHRFKHPPKV